MGQRIFATLFIVAFFAALPMWFLSTQEGWVTVECVGESAALRCRVHERFAFTTRDVAYVVQRAELVTQVHRARRGTYTTYQLALVTPTGRVPALVHHTGNRALRQVVADLNAALDARAPQLTAMVSPDFGFWFSVFLVGLFSGAGLLIAASGNRAAKRE